MSLMETVSKEPSKTGTTPVRGLVTVQLNAVPLIHNKGQGGVERGGLTTNRDLGWCVASNGQVCRVHRSMFERLDTVSAVRELRR